MESIEKNVTADREDQLGENILLLRKNVCQFRIQNSEKNQSYSFIYFIDPQKVDHIDKKKKQCFLLFRLYDECDIGYGTNRLYVKI